jgi:hypothetical protein
VLPPFLPKAKYTPWWSPNLNALQKQVNALKRRVKRSKNKTLKEIYMTCFKALNNLYKSELLKAKQDSWSRAPKKHPGEFTRPAKRASQGSQSLPR